MKSKWTTEVFPKMSAMRSELEQKPDADVVEMYINEERATALHFYYKRLSRDLCRAVEYRKEGQELELPDGTLVVFIK